MTGCSHAGLARCPEKCHALHLGEAFNNGQELLTVAERSMPW